MNMKDLENFVARGRAAQKAVADAILTETSELKRMERLEAERARLEKIVLEQQETIRKLSRKLDRLGTTNIELNKQIGRYESRLLAASVKLIRKERP